MNACTECGKRRYLMPLHGDKGGPLMCPICIGAWNAEHTKRRKWGRIVIKAMGMYLNEGGRWNDLDRLKMAVGGYGWAASALAPDYLNCDLAADVPDITSDLLDDILQLVHPDRHPEVRGDLAKRVTQDLLLLKPFVFPAPKPEPEPSGTYSKQTPVEPEAPWKKPYPCEICADVDTNYYCSDCKAEQAKRIERNKAREEEARKAQNARNRSRYNGRRGAWLETLPVPECESCGEEFIPKRLDAKYCSPACRQRAYRKRDGKASNSGTVGGAYIEEIILAAFTAEPDNAFTTQDLCARVWPETHIWKKHRTAVIAVARGITERQWRETPEAAWDWDSGWTPGCKIVFFNSASNLSYAMRRLKTDNWNRYASDEELRAKLQPGGEEHKYIVEGGSWRGHWQEYLTAKRAAEMTDSPKIDGVLLTNRNDAAAEVAA